MKETISIIIPAFNEAENLNLLLPLLVKVCNPLSLQEIIVVNDHSSDNTSEVIAQFHKKYSYIKECVNQGSRGMGSALKSGTSSARGDFIVWVMADCSDDFSILPQMINELINGYDAVISSRYMVGGSRGELGMIKGLLSKGYSSLARIVYNIPLHDITNAYRAFRKTIYQKIILTNDDFSLSPEFALKAHLAGFKMTEVPSTYYNRKHGKSTFNFIKMGYKYLKILLCPQS